MWHTISHFGISLLLWLTSSPSSGLLFLFSNADDSAFTTLFAAYYFILFHIGFYSNVTITIYVHIKWNSANHLFRLAICLPLVPGQPHPVCKMSPWGLLSQCGRHFYRISFCFPCLLLSSNKMENFQVIWANRPRQDQEEGEVQLRTGKSERRKEKDNKI